MRSKTTVEHPEQKPVKLDIGCGMFKRDGYTGVDRLPFKGVDVVCNVEKGLPFKSNSIDEIYTSHFLEHTNNFIFIMEEFYRVLKPNGILEIKVPHWASFLAYSEYHVRFFTLFSFQEFDDGYPIVFRSSDKARFKILKRRFMYSGGRFTKPYAKVMNMLANIKPEYFEAYVSQFFPPKEIYFKLKAIKGSKKKLQVTLMMS